MAAKSRFSIEATISMIDKVSPNMGKAARSVTGFSKKIRRQFAGADVSAQRINKSINRVGGRAARVGFAGLTIGIGLVAREFVKFDDAIFGATARFKAAEKPGTDMTKVMQNLRDAARKTGAETQFTATQAAEGLNKFALAGFTSEEAIMSLRSQIDLTTATGEDFMRVADISSDLLGAFGFA
ncbi:phage tail tape measure protein, partial [Candidatus Pacearchaeota archaeon]|nr:phage tail tape measure protein [Candidatus Pacearchaeota archaeon]